MSFKNFDAGVINFFGKVYLPLTRFALFVIFFWFGILKVLGLSPASNLVQNLFEKTIPFMSFHSFIVAFGIFECLIGIMFLIRGLERVVILLLFLHMITTFLPLFLLPQEMWSAFLVPTLEGQYVIKNLLIIAAAITIGAQLKPIKSSQKNA